MFTVTKYADVHIELMLMHLINDKGMPCNHVKLSKIIMKYTTSVFVIRCQNQN